MQAEQLSHRQPRRAFYTQHSLPRFHMEPGSTDYLSSNHTISPVTSCVILATDSNHVGQAQCHESHLIKLTGKKTVFSKLDLTS